MSLAIHNFDHMPALLDKMDKFFDETEDDRLDFKEFSIFLHNFMPDASEHQLDRMFKNLDSDGLNTISKQQLMESAFFTEFIRTSDKMFSIREQELLNERQTEVINQLQEYVNTIGRPAEFDNERLKQELRDIREEKRFLERQNDALRSEVSNLQATERMHQQEIELLHREQEDQVQEIRELHQHAVESAESSNEFALIEKDLENERHRVKELQEGMRKQTESYRDCEFQLRQRNLEKKKLELENEKLFEKNDRLVEELAQCSDQWKAERVRADTLAETVIILESNLDDQNEIIQERDRMTEAQTQRVMRINSDAFVLDEMSVMDVGEEDDLFSQFADDSSSTIMTIPVSMFEATPEPTASPRPGFKRLIKRARKYAHGRSKSYNMPLLTPRSRRAEYRPETPGLLTLPTTLGSIASSPTSSLKSKESIEAIQNTIQREMQDVGDRIVEQVVSQSDRSEELLSALTRLQSEVSDLKRNVSKDRGRQNSQQEGEPRWVGKIRRDIAHDTKRTVSRLLKEVEDAPATQSRGGCCFWPWSDTSDTDYQPLNGS